MSQALFDQAAGGRHSSDSAGTRPATRVHPQVVEVMGESGIDLSGHIPKKLGRKAVERADVVVTMGCGDECPYVPGKRYLDWDLPDPSGRPVDEVRGLRVEIMRRVTGLIRDLDQGAGAVG